MASISKMEKIKQGHKPLFVIQPHHKFDLGFRDLWVYRDLLIILAGRDLKLRYKQTFLGVSWVILQPSGDGSNIYGCFWKFCALA